MFHITYDDGQIQQHLALKGPKVDLKPGDVLVATTSFFTPAHEYEENDEFVLLERTQEAPHHRLCSLGNWRVRDKFFTSIWSNIEWAIQDGLLKVKGSDSVN